MSPPSELDLLQRSRKQSLQRQLTALDQLSAQVTAWRHQAREGGPLALHQSQIEALCHFVQALQVRLVQGWSELEAAPDAEFAANGRAVLDLITKVFFVWHYYNERLDQRIGSDSVYRRFLAVADEVAWSAYRVFLGQAHDLGIITDLQRFKQPPLLHLFERPSPVIHTRKRRELVPLPVHVIDLPYYETWTAWSLLGLFHEVAHGVVADVAVDPGAIVLTEADAVGLGPDRREHWMWWADEIVADCFGILQGGPPFVRELMDVLMVLGPGDPEKGSASHPPPYVRIPLACTFLSTLEESRSRPSGQVLDRSVDQTYKGLAAHFEGVWRSLYRQVEASLFEPYLDEREEVLTLLMDSRLAGLGHHTLRELGSFTPSNYRQVEYVAADYLYLGDTPGEPIAPRLVIPAARIAFDRLTANETDPVALSEKLDTLHERTLQTVEANPAQEGTRALYPGEEEFLDGLAAVFASRASPIELLAEAVL